MQSSSDSITHGPAITNSGNFVHSIIIRFAHLPSTNPRQNHAALSREASTPGIGSDDTRSNSHSPATWTVWLGCEGSPRRQGQRSPHRASPSPLSHPLTPFPPRNFRVMRWVREEKREYSP